MPKNSKKKNNNNNQKNKKKPVKKPSDTELKNLLNRAQQLKQEEKKNLSDKLIDSIDCHIKEINRENFHTLAFPLTIYVDALVETKNRNEKINRLEERLKALNKMKEDESFIRFQEIWECLLNFLRLGKPIPLIKNEDDFSYFYWAHRLNILIQEDKILLDKIVQSIVPGAFFDLTLENISRVSFCALMMEDNASFNQLLAFYLSEEDNHALSILMDNACEAGRFDVVNDLIKKGVPVPNDMDSLLLVTNNAYAAEDTDFLIFVFSNYGYRVIFDRALERHFYGLALLIIFLDEQIVPALMKEQLHRFVELTAAQGNRLILNVLFATLPIEERKDLFVQHVVPYLYAESQEGDSSVSCRIIGLLRYYMDKNLFTFSLEEEKLDPKKFGPRACGYLCQWISYAYKLEDAHFSGVVRQSMLLNKIIYSEEIQESYSRINQILDTSGRKNHELISNLNLMGIGYTISYERDRSYQLSQYVRLMSSTEECPSNVLGIVGTRPSEFNALSTLIQSISSQLPNNFSLFFDLDRTSKDDEQTLESMADLVDQCCGTLEKRQEILKNIARIIGLSTHAMFYIGDSYFITGLIHSAMLLSKGLKDPFNWKEENHTQTNGIKAQSLVDLEEWVALYPTLFGYQTYTECIWGLGQLERDSIAHTLFIDELEKELLNKPERCEPSFNRPTKQMLAGILKGVMTTLFSAKQPSSASNNNNNNNDNDNDNEAFSTGMTQGFFN